MEIFKKHLIYKKKSIKEALSKLNELSQDAIIFVVDEVDRLIGSITDGDIRRGLLNNYSLEDNLEIIIQPAPRFIFKDDINIEKVIEYRENGFRIIPLLDKNRKVINIINFRYLKSFLPIDVVIMAGGRGQRLQPLTDFTPKPMLKVGEKPIIELNLDRLKTYGIQNFWISLKYLGEQIESYLENGEKKNVSIEYVWEEEPMGTIGAVSKIKNFKNEYILVTNSDLMCNVDYENFFLDFINQNADFSVLTIPYSVNIPYAVLETVDNHIKSFKEKPTYTFYSNGGIYLMKKDILKYIPKDIFYNSTDLMEKLIKEKYKVISYPFWGYWLDIGKHDDFEKAQKDIQTFKF